MHHYNFPSYSVGETKPSRGPGRREIGHGALAEKALMPVLPSQKKNSHMQSELYQKHSSQMVQHLWLVHVHHVCHLWQQVFRLRAMVAGISCGLVTGDTDDDYVLLTDIQGLEDFFGDMDFKVTGTTEGITAIQMDIKIHGLTRAYR